MDADDADYDDKKDDGSDCKAIIKKIISIMKLSTHWNWLVKSITQDFGPS